MAKQHYGITALMDPDPFSFGHSSDQAVGSVPAQHKWNYAASPYCVANEFICGTIGQFLGLPIPPFAITRPKTSDAPNQIFSSLHFNFEGRDLAPVSPPNCVASLPDICAGVIVFDVLIGNADRHNKNLAVDRLANPSEMQVFDHDGGLFGFNMGTSPHGIERLKFLEGRFGISGSDMTGGSRHCLIDALLDSETLTCWTHRLWQIGYDFIKRTCDRAQQYGLTSEESAAACGFLHYRSRCVSGILNRHRSEFTSVNRWVLV